jgi:AMMECR1 domain-containing protein
MEQVCRKAGLSRTAWMDEEARLYRFEAAVFSEDELAL